MDWAVILAGGVGSRFWPLSSRRNPKILLPLAGTRSTAEESLDRLAGFIPPERTLIVTSSALAPLLVERLQLDPANVMAEPRAASTGPALAWATWEARRRDPEATVLSLHADWVIGDPAAFVRTAASLMATGSSSLIISATCAPAASCRCCAATSARTIWARFTVTTKRFFGCAISMRSEASAAVANFGTSAAAHAPGHTRQRVR